MAAGVGSGPPKKPANSASTHSVNFAPSSTGSPIVTRNISVGNRIAELRHEVALALGLELLDQLDRALVHQRLDPPDGSGREPPVEHLAHPRVVRRVEVVRAGTGPP